MGFFGVVHDLQIGPEDVGTVLALLEGELGAFTGVLTGGPSCALGPRCGQWRRARVQARCGVRTLAGKGAGLARLGRRLPLRCLVVIA